MKKMSVQKNEIFGMIRALAKIPYMMLLLSAFIARGVVEYHTLPQFIRNSARSEFIWFTISFTISAMSKLVELRHILKRFSYSLDSVNTNKERYWHAFTKLAESIADYNVAHFMLEHFEYKTPWGYTSNNTEYTFTSLATVSALLANGFDMAELALQPQELVETPASEKQDKPLKPK